MAQPGTPTSIILAIKGLFLNPSTFGNNAPTGALTIANNVVIDRPSVVATRRGFSNAFSTINTNASSMFQYAGVKLLHGTDNLLYDDLLGNGVYGAYAGVYTVPDTNNPESRVRAVETNKNFYFLTGEGTYRLDSPSGTPRLAGAPPGLSGTGVVAGDPSGFLPTLTNIAYRVVFGYKDANQQLILGAPSSRIVVQNPSANSDNVALTFQTPKEIQANPLNFFFQVYRSEASPNLATEPDDEMALVYEDVCTAAASITISDITPDTLKGASLYTNNGQDGILQSNYRPPWALDVCTFKQYAFYANTRNLHNAEITLIAAGASNGPDALLIGDTITFTMSEFGGNVFTLIGAAANNAALGEFAVQDSGGTNPGGDIQVTASNIALIANAYATNTSLDCYYTSTGNDLPGKLRFNRLSLTKNSFAITVSRAASWEQATPITSTNDERPNRIYFSKFNQPEAVPLVNYIEVGSANAPIVRVIPLRDGIMVLKQDGIFRISNAAPPFTITPIDYNVRILAANTAAELDNKVYFLSDQGVVALSDSDSQIMSFVLDKTIIENTSPTLFPNLKATAWGIAYQSDRKYILNMPTSSVDVQARQQYVYNHITEVWTRWTLAVSCGLVFRGDSRLYLGSRNTAPTLGSYVYQERKTFTQADFADNEYTTNNTTAGNLQTIIIDNPALPPGVELLPGWTVTQTLTGAVARITDISVGLTQTTLTMSQIQNWTVGNVVIYTPVYTEVQTIQIDCENPGMNKQYSEIVYIFTKQDFSQIVSRMSSNTTGTPQEDYLIPNRTGGWGIDPWGVTPWGGGPSGQGKIRRYVPQRVQRAGWVYVNLTNAEAFTEFGWSGLELFYKNTSSRQK